MAGILNAYRDMQGSDEAQLAAELGCLPAQLPLLGLCREPRRDAPRFADDIRQIAAVAGANVLRLAQVIRAVDSLRALGGSRDTAGGYLAAARDADAEREGDSGHPGGTDSGDASLA